MCSRAWLNTATRLPGLKTARVCVMLLHVGLTSLASQDVVMRTRLVVSALCLVSSACSQALVVQKDAMVETGEVVCRKVARTGSHVSKTVCTSEAQRRQESIQTQAALEQEKQRQRGRIRIDPNRLPSSRR